MARFELWDLTEFKRWILGFGRHAVVLSPKKLVKEIASELAQARVGYRTAAVWRSYGENVRRYPTHTITKGRGCLTAGLFFYP